MRKLLLIGMVSLLLVSCAVAAGNAQALFGYSYWQQSGLEEREIEEISDLSYFYAEKQADLSVEFSHRDFFYQKAFSLELTTSHPDAILYYTTNGGEPTRESTKYVEPIFISQQENACIVVKAVAVLDDVTGPVTTHSYFVWEDVNERFAQDMIVFSLSSDEYGLYDYDDGILVPGRIFDEFSEENADTGLAEIHWPGNYKMTGREWERLAYVEAFENGRRVVAQYAGLRLHGGASRWYNQKSLRLIARSEYQAGVGKFHYNFFPGLTSVGEYPSYITAYDTIVLNNGGNDLVQGMIRTPLLTSILQEAGYTAVSPVRPAIVFLNGEYYGFAWLNVRFNENLFETLYQAPSRDFDIVEGGHSALIEASARVTIEYDALTELAQTKGFLNDYTFAQFTDKYDIENYLFYYALEYYLANNDWMVDNQNMRLWRYTGTEKSEGALDGKWRFLVYDLDQCWFEDARFTLGDILQHGPILAAVLEREDMRELFANYVCDIAQLYSSQNVNEALQNMLLQSMDEMRLSHLEGAEVEDDFSRRWNRLLESHKTLVGYAQTRFNIVLEEMRNLFGYTDLYTVELEGPARLNMYNNTKGSYFVENTVAVHPHLEAGQYAEYWLVNGQRIDTEVLTVSADDAVDGTVAVELVYAEQLPQIRFVNAYDEGDICGFVIENTTDKKILLGGLYLSDNRENLQKYAIGNIRMGAGLQLEFVGKSSYSGAALLKLQLTFNPRSGEVVYLSDEDGNILDYIMVP